MSLLTVVCLSGLPIVLFPHIPRKFSINHSTTEFQSIEENGHIIKKRDKLHNSLIRRRLENSIKYN